MAPFSSSAATTESSRRFLDALSLARYTSVGLAPFWEGHPEFLLLMLCFSAGMPEILRLCNQ